MKLYIFKHFANRANKSILECDRTSAEKIFKILKMMPFGCCTPTDIEQTYGHREREEEEGEMYGESNPEILRYHM